MNILVTGANGQLGQSIRRLSYASGDDYLFTDIDSLDICDKDAVENFILNHNIELIVNCAAYTNVDGAEDNRDLANAINFEAVANIANAAKRQGAFLIHISTDYIFDLDVNTPISEDCTPNPQCVYGQSKLLGERAISDSGCRAIVLRTAWLYSEFGHNFVKTMLNLMASRHRIDVVIDQIGSPTYAGDLAKLIVEIVAQRKYIDNEGVYNYTNEGICSWFDFAKHIQHTAALLLNDKSQISACKVSPCTSSQFVTKAKRPAYSVLDKSKVKASFGIEIPYWAGSLQKCIAGITNDTTTN